MTRAWLVALVLLAWPPPPQAGSITGRVYDDAGRPVADARVTAVSRTAGVAQSTQTTADGAYALPGLATGTYTLTAERPGFAAREYGQTAPLGPGTPITISAGDQQYAVLVLDRLGSISGRVVDERGRPVSVTVIAMRWIQRGGIRAQAPLARTTSDRHGRYVLSGLIPGECIVVAMARPGDLQPMTPDVVRQALAAVADPSAPLPIDREGSGTVSYVSSYYPGVVSPSAAVPVVVAPGTAQAGINLRLLLMPTARVEGIVRNEDGTPAAYAGVTIASLGDNAPTGLVGQTSADGRFSIGTVPHGTYVLLAGMGAATVQVTGTMVTGVEVIQPARVAVAGRVEFVGASPRPGPGPGRTLRVVFMPAASSVIANVPPPMAVIPVRPDGTFGGEVPPGVYRASIVEARAAGPVWTAESMMAADRDILDDTVIVRTGQPLTNLSVTLVDQPTEISGVLRHPDGTPEPGVMMVAFAVDERFWTHGSRRVRSTLPDPEGGYRITGLPPGEYFVGAVGRFDTSNGIGTEVLAALVAASTRVTLARGQHVEQDFIVGGGR